MENKRHHPLFVVFTIMLLARVALAQTNRIPPIHIDEWFANRLWYIAIAGAVLGFLVSNFWLPRLSSVPHQNDNRKARKHFYISLVVSLALLAIYLVIDASFIYRFGRQSYTFWESFLQIWLTWQTFIMLLLAALIFTLVTALWTRFLSNKPYRYMLIGK